MPGSTTRTGRADTPGRLALATVGNHASVPAALGRRPAPTLPERSCARRRRLQEPQRARHGHLSRLPVTGGSRSGHPHRIQLLVRHCPGRPCRTRGREAGARGRPARFPWAWMVQPGPLRRSREPGAGARDRPGRPRRSEMVRAGRPHRRPGPATGAPGRPHRSRLARRLLPCRRCRGSRDSGMGARDHPCWAQQRGRAYRLGQRPGPGVFRSGHARPEAGDFSAGRPRQSWLAGEVPAGHRGLPGARLCAFPAWKRRWLPPPRGARPGNQEPGQRPPESRSQAVRCLESHRARGHPARQCRPGYAGPGRPAHPDSPWRERILLRG